MTGRQYGVREPMPGVVYPPREDLQRYVDAGAFTAETLIGAFRDSFRRHSSRIALNGPDGPMTYREMDERSDRLAAALLGLGVKPLERALFQMQNSVELVIAVFACLKVGVIPVCTLTGHREHEIGELGRRAAAAVHFVQGDDPKFDFPAFALKMSGEVSSMRHVVVAGGKPVQGTLAMESLIDSVDPDSARAAVDDVVAALDPFQIAVFQLSGARNAAGEGFLRPASFRHPRDRVTEGVLRFHRGRTQGLGSGDPQCEGAVGLTV